MPERVLQRAITVAIKLVLHWLDDLRPRGNGLGKQRIDILYIQVKTDGRAAQRLRITGWTFFAIVPEHDSGITNADFGVSDFSAWRVQPEHLDRTKSAHGKRECLGCTFDHQVRGYRMVSVGYRFYRHMRSPIQSKDCKEAKHPSYSAISVP